MAAKAKATPPPRLAAALVSVDSAVSSASAGRHRNHPSPKSASPSHPRKVRYSLLVDLGHAMVVVGVVLILELSLPPLLDQIMTPMKTTTILNSHWTAPRALAGVMEARII